MKRIMWLLAVTTVAVFPGSAEAHQSWLAPSTYRAQAGDTVIITCFVGTGFRGELKPYATTRTLKLSLQGKKLIDLRPGAMNGDLTMSRFVTADDGGGLVSYQSTFVPIELEAAEFDRYLALEGLDVPLRARADMGANAGPGRERYARCSKTWIGGRDLGRLTKPVGLPLELVPLGDPEASSSLRVRLLYQGKPLPGALVKAWNRPLAHGTSPEDAATRDSIGVAGQARTDSEGIAVLPVDHPGEWMVNAVHMIPCRDRTVADWESLWASLTFARGLKARKS